MLTDTRSTAIDVAMQLLELNLPNLDGVMADHDSTVPGVWRVRFNDGLTCVVYLAGYGGRAYSDIEVAD